MTRYDLDEQQLVETEEKRFVAFGGQRLLQLDASRDVMRTMFYLPGATAPVAVEVFRDDDGNSVSHAPMYWYLRDLQGTARNLLVDAVGGLGIYHATFTTDGRLKDVE